MEDMFSMAKRMLRVDVLPESLSDRISRVIELVHIAKEDFGGKFRSSQVLACIIADWERSGE